MSEKFRDLIEENPVIAAIKNDDGLEKCCQDEEIKIVFVLYGNICTLPSITGKLHQAGKVCMVHVDLISGLAAKDVSIDFIRKNTQADGIISTKPLLIKRAAELGYHTALRVFTLDSMAYDNIEKELKIVKPDVIEILPGVMPKVIRRVCQRFHLPVIASGLISDKEDIMTALNAGAAAISSTNPEVWGL